MADDEKMKELEVYLQDHYAGAVGAIELLGHLIKTHAGKQLERFFTSCMRTSDQITSSCAMS